MYGRALRFGSVAEAYERYRPGYPDEVVDLVLAYAGRPVDTALEIGAGTGKATRAFASRGIDLTATDPDAAMLTELRRRVPSARTTQAAFEQLTWNGAYDLVFAAAALHWTEPADRWTHVAALLRPGGTFASFGGPVQLADADLEAEVRAARSAFLDTDDVPSPDGTPQDSALQWPGTELVASALFTDVQQRTVERRLTWSAHDYVGHLSTVSAYLELDEPIRATTLERISAVLPATVSVDADITVHLARRS